jgi:hypothetical protein
MLRIRTTVANTNYIVANTNYNIANTNYNIANTNYNVANTIFNFGGNMTPYLLKWFRSYLTGRKQRVIIDGQSSDWRQIEAGVPQGCVLGPLLFCIYINDITTNLQSNYFLYADDTSLLEIVDDPALTTAKLNNDLELINIWTKKWLVTINPDR